MKLKTRILSLLLALCLFATGSIVVSAKEEELYLADLRIVYAEDYEEAQKVLQNTEFKNYKLLNYNLNATASKVDLGFVTFGDGNGVFLAYKTTTNVDEAITDVAIMQMNGGYREGNYLEMVAKNREEYEKVGATYMTAINYMIEAYYAGDFLAESAYRQLELYYDDDHKMTLGAYFETQPGADALATMFLEGNRHAIKNIRSLIGMGVSYNEDGMTYLQKVSEAAIEMDNDSAVFDDEGYEDLAETIANSIVTFREMLRELSGVEDQLNFVDEEFTDLELQYAEHQALAEMLRKTPYRTDTTLYDFCYNYYEDESDYSSLYPLVHALNEGQKAITTAGNYYDAVRYSMTEFPESFMDEEISKMETQYADDPFSIYAGVDRSVFKNTFALTTDAYRADVSSDKGFLESVYGLDQWKRWGLEIAASGVGAGIFAWAIVRTKNWISTNAAAKVYQAARYAQSQVYLKAHQYFRLTEVNFGVDGSTMLMKPEDALESIVAKFVNTTSTPYNPATVPAGESPFLFKLNYANDPKFTADMPDYYKGVLEKLNADSQKVIEKAIPQGSGYEYGKPLPEKVVATGLGSKLFTVALYAVGAALMAYSAYSYGSQIHSYYNPTYKDIPTAMIDLVKTEDGDKYIKYDAAMMATMNDKKGYDAADLNAFEGQRWNALYFTKSYEAGKPLLANAASLKVVTNSNVAPENHLAVHRFGESVCYDLNKYNFEYDDSIYLSIAQSDKQKTAITGVPDVVGSILGSGLYFLAAGAGIAFGIGGTIGTQKIMKKKKASKDVQNAPKTDA